MHTAASPGWLMCGSTGSTWSHLSFNKGQESIPLLLPCASRAKTEKGEGNRHRPWGEASPAAYRRPAAVELRPGPCTPTRSCSPADGAPRRPGHGGRYPRRRRLRRLGAATKWRHGMGVMRCIPPVASACPTTARGNPATHAGWQGPQQPVAATFGGRIGSAGRLGRCGWGRGRWQRWQLGWRATAVGMAMGLELAHGGRAATTCCGYLLLLLKRGRQRRFGSGGVNGRLRRG